MAGIFSELLKSLQGAAGTDVGAVKRGAVAGGRQVAGIADDTNKIDLNTLVNQIDLNGAEPYYGDGTEHLEKLPVQDTPLPLPAGDYAGPSAAKEALFSSVLKAIEEQQAPTPSALATMPLPIPVGGVQTETPTGMPEPVAAVASPKPAVKTSVAARPVGTQPAAPKADDELARILGLATKTQDRSKDKADLEAQRAAKLKEADSEKQLSDDEKIATALIGVLPGLLGAIGGGIAAGGVGAAAGAAGGLQGAAQGVGNMVAAKEGRRKEAKTDADKLAERIAVLDEQINAQQQKANDRELSVRMAEREAAKAASMGEKKMALERELARLGSNTQLTVAGINSKTALKKAEIDAYTDLQKAQAAAEAGKMGKMTDGDKAFYLQVGSGMRAASDIEGLVKAGAANIGAHLSDSGNAHLLDTKVAQLSHALTKIADPTSAVLLTELETTRKNMLAEPTTTRTQVFLTKVKEAEQEIAKKAIDMGKFTGLPINEEVQRWASGGQPAQEPASQGPTVGTTVRQNGHLYTWNGSSWE